MLLINNILILFSLLVFSTQESQKSLNETPKPKVENISEEIVLSFEDQPGLEASNFPG